MIFFGFAVPVMVLLVSGCAMSAGDGYPSLTKRAVEGRLDVMPSAPVIEAPGPLPVDLAGRLARWRGDSATAAQAFSAEREVAEPLVTAAAGASISSENWVVAQQAISRLQATRAPLTGALADIDRLYLQRSIDESIDGLPAIYALRDDLIAMVMAQDAVLAGLVTRLSSQ
jgi:hypothetical protein